MIVIVDYGMGNLRSVSKALEHLGGETSVSSDPSAIAHSDKLVLPGVGAFGDAMHELKARQLVKPIQDFLKQGKKFLGICLGMQLLFSESEESPGIPGLGLYPGKVQGFRSSDIKIPHMGWNSIQTTKKHALLKNIPEQSYFYFVHSYYVVPQDNSLTAATCQYGSEVFPAMIGTDSAFATQFHPEKSQEAGLTVLKNFLKW